MGRLSDALKRKKYSEKVQEQEQVQQEQKAVQQKYNRAWAGRMAIYHGFEISNNDQKVDGIIGALNRRDGQCPCGGTGAQFKCPCIIMRTKGICKCGLFKTIEDRKVGSTQSTAKIKVGDE